MPIPILPPGTRRPTLRAATRASHQRIEAMLSARSCFESAAGYGRFLRAGASARARLEHWASALIRDGRDRGWAPFLVCDAMRADLADLGEHADWGEHADLGEHADWGAKPDRVGPAGRGEEPDRGERAAVEEGAREDIGPAGAGGCARESTLPEPFLWGAMYVLAGSCLGATIICRKVEPLGLSANWGARHLFAQAAAAPLWPALVRELEANVWTEQDERHCLDGAHFAFRRMERALEAAWRD